MIRRTSTICIVLITILVFVLITTSSLLFLFLADYDEKKEAFAVDPSMMMPPPTPPTTAPPSNNKNNNNNNVVSKQVTPDIVTQSKIKSKSDKICFDAYIEAIIDFLAGENLQNKIPELIKRSEKDDAASYEFICYIHGRAIVSLLLEKYIPIPD